MGDSAFEDLKILTTHSCAHHCKSSAGQGGDWRTAGASWLPSSKFGERDCLKRMRKTGRSEQDT